MIGNQCTVLKFFEDKPGSPWSCSWPTLAHVLYAQRTSPYSYSEASVSVCPQNGVCCVFPGYFGASHHF